MNVDERGLFFQAKLRALGFVVLTRGVFLRPHHLCWHAINENESSYTCLFAQGGPPLLCSLSLLLRCILLYLAKNLMTLFFHRVFTAARGEITAFAAGIEAKPDINVALVNGPAQCCWPELE